MPLFPLPLDTERNPPMSRGEWLFRDAVSRAEEGDMNVDGLLRVLERSRDGLRRQSQHGDLVPWHLLGPVAGRLGLIDAEHAGSLLPRYYDAAYCYMRIVTWLGDFALASVLLEQLRRRLSVVDRAALSDEIGPVLAYLTICAIWEVRNHPFVPVCSMARYHRLRDIIIDGVSVD